jgi:hypothetical protein
MTYSDHLYIYLYHLALQFLLNSIGTSKTPFLSILEKPFL